MAGINTTNTGTNPLSAYKAPALEAAAATSLDTGTKTISATDANQSRSGLSQLQAVAAGINLVQAATPLLFEDKTPTNGGSSLKPFQATSIDQFGQSASATRAPKSQAESALISIVNALPAPIQPFVTPVVARLFLGNNQNFSSVGDPHETTGDGLKFDNELTGKFIAFRSDEGDLEIQKDQGPDQSGRWPGMTLNHAVAMKVGANTINFDINNALKINGRSVPMKDGVTNLPDGTSVAIAGSSLSVTSPRGDVINVSNQDSYLNLTGTISGKRPTDSVQGSLGAFHQGGDQSQDLVMRNGSAVGLAKLNDFLNSWRVPGSESLF